MKTYVQGELNKVIAIVQQLHSQCFFNKNNMYFLLFLSD